MDIDAVPHVFLQLQSDERSCMTDFVHTQDGFWMICKSLSERLAHKGIVEIPNADGTRFACDKFFDDWFLYAVPNGHDYVFSLLKLREQEGTGTYSERSGGRLLPFQFGIVRGQCFCARAAGKAGGCRYHYHYFRV